MAGCGGWLCSELVNPPVAPRYDLCQGRRRDPRERCVAPQMHKRSQTNLSIAETILSTDRSPCLLDWARSRWQPHLLKIQLLKMPRCGGQAGRRINKRRRRRRRLRVATSEGDYDGRFPTAAQSRELLGRLLAEPRYIHRFDISAAFLRRLSDVIWEDGDG